jgi:hypothetical protein
MDMSITERRAVKFGVYFFGFFAGIIYAMQMIPALMGHPLDQKVAPGIAVVSLAYGYCLWASKGRKGWQGALVGLGIFLVVWGAGNYISRVHPAH